MARPFATRRKYSKNAAARAESTIRIEVVVDDIERRMIEEALRASGGNKQKAAQALGLSRQGLINKLK